MRKGDSMNWGEAGYQNCLDYTKMNEEMQAHKEEILKGYKSCLLQFVIALTSNNFSFLCGL